VVPALVRLRTSRAKAAAGLAAAALASLLIAACQTDQNTGVGGGVPSTPSPDLLATASAAVTAALVPTSPTPVPAPPAEPAASVNFVNAPLSARPGQATTLIVRTSPNTGCTIEVDYKSGPSHAQGLVPKTSDGSGNVAWTWIVGTRTTPGEWPIFVTCGSASNQTYIKVT
jgi:hypothetical protein